MRSLRVSALPVVRLCAVGAILACAGASFLSPGRARAATDAPGIAPARIADGELRRALGDLVRVPGGPPGAIAVIRRDGRSAVYRAGVKDLANGRPWSWLDHMRIASVAKAYSGAVALHLVDRGLLSLDDTIAERLPELPDAWGEVTLRELLSHTSGLPDYTQSEEFQQIVMGDPRTYFPPETLLDYVADEDLEFTPGSEYRYSNSDNVAVAYMAEAVTGRSYDELLEEIVFDRLRIDDTSLPETAELPSPFAHGYFRESD